MTPAERKQARRATLRATGRCTECGATTAARYCAGCAARQSQARRSTGYAGDRAATLDEVGAALGISREAVRQAEVRGLRKLRTALSAAGYDGGDVAATSGKRWS